MGYNYYYKLPEPQRYPILRKLDNMFISDPRLLHTHRLRKLASEQGFHIEISEAQAEPWTTVTSPGNSASEFRFVLLRCMREVLNLQEKSVIRYWGIEELAKKALANELTDEHKQIIELIQKVNM
jgi:hypothetical protein